MVGRIPLARLPAAEVAEMTRPDAGGASFSLTRVVQRIVVAKTDGVPSSSWK